jgi:CheY-like chemotaxis protein
MSITERLDLSVLITDDDPIVLLIHSNIIQRSELSKHKPRCFQSAIETLDFLKDNLDREHLILLDINMPEMTGWQMIDYIEKTFINHRIYILVVSSSVDRADHLKAKEYECVLGFFEKPITTELINDFRNSQIFMNTFYST